MDSEGVILALAREKVDSEIEDLKERIRALRTKRNTFTLVSRCPPEIMTQIFTWVQQGLLGRTFYPEGYIPSYYRHWMRVAHVCQYWRHITVTSKVLWNVIPAGSVTYATESFNRLGSVPFFLVGDSYRWDDKMTALWTAISAECHRIRFIRGVNGRQSLTDFKNPMPLLEHVEIDRKCELSPSIFSPALRTLKLTGSDFTWDWPALPHLTTLEVSHPTKTIAFDAFLDILQKSPQLKRLLVENIFPSSNPTQPKDFKPCQSSPLLPKLSFFHSAKSVFSADLLARLRFTDDCPINVSAGLITQESVPGLMLVLNRVLVESSTVVRKMTLTSGYGYSEGLQLSLSDGLGHMMTQIAFSVGNWFEDNMGRCIRDMTALPLDQVESLSAPIIRTATTWQTSGLGQLPNLRRIDVGKGGRAFFSYIIDDFKASHGQGGLSFTSLEDVVTESLEVGRELKYPLCAALAGREKAGYRFKKLDFISGNLSEDSVKQLQKYVDCVKAPLPRKKTKGQRRR